MLLQLHQVSYAYGQRWALREVELTLPEGRIGLLGPNGAGKSTLLRILLGLLRPSRGSGQVLGCPLDKLDHRVRRQIGYMPESSCLIPGLRGVEYVALAGILSGLPRQQAWRQAHQVLDLLGLDEIRYRRAEEYSTGMQQRLKLAQALVHRPRLLLLDEPTSGLDPVGREALLDLLLSLTQELQLSVILSSHILSEVQRVCERVVVLYQGRVLAQGPIAELCPPTHRIYRLAVFGDGDSFCRALLAHRVEILQPSDARDHLPHSPDTGANQPAAPRDERTTTQPMRTRLRQPEASETPAPRTDHGDPQPPVNSAGSGESGDTTAGYAGLAGTQHFLVRVTDDWPTRRFFELAEQSGAVIQHLSQDRDRLDDFYHRLLHPR
jgi:ABC-2 type transport system ATP-binding protein